MAPIRHGFARPLADPVLPTVDEVVADLRPSEPLVCLRPVAVADAAQRFVRSFPGDVLYAVKCNPEPRVLRALWAGGVRHFDCASLGEVRLVRALLPQAAIHFMHPVKARPAIAEAFERWGVADFVLDSADELAKIVQETVPVGLVGDPPALGLLVRLALPKGTAVYDLSGKFGAAADEAARLLRAARPHAARLGVSFHVGSQCLDPAAYARAMALAAEIVAAAKVSSRDRRCRRRVSGQLSRDDAAAARRSMSTRSRAAAAALPAGVRLWAEPGRALVAAGGSVVAQVQLRRGNALYVNDGVYGNLSDAGALGFRFPARRIRLGEAGARGTRSWPISPCLVRPATAPTR